MSRSERRSGVGVGYDPPLTEALERVSEGNLDLGLRLIKQARGRNDLRALRISRLGEAAGRHLDVLAGKFGDDPDALLWLGSARVSLAWEIRGGGYAKYVTEDAFRGFHEVLETAADPLFAAADLVPDDPVPWQCLQWFGLGMSLPRPELDRFWAETEARDPGLWAGRHARLQTLCQKWRGSNEEAYAFAKETALTAETGNPVVAMLPLAHFEIAERRMLADDGQHDHELIVKSHFSRAEVRQELAETTDRWMSAPHDHPMTTEARHLFGAAFYYGGDHDRARRIMTDLPMRIPEWLPWGSASVLPRRTYLRVRRELGV